MGGAVTAPVKITTWMLFTTPQVEASLLAGAVTAPVKITTWMLFTTKFYRRNW